MLVRLTATLTTVIGVMVLAGWTLGLPALKSALPGAVEMKTNTALGLVLAGCALLILGNRPSLPFQRLAQILALAVGALGLATLGEYLFGWQLGIDELLFRDAAGAYNVARGRMSPYSAAAFVSIGLALAILPRPRLRPLARWAAGAMTVIGTLSLLGYLWKADELITDHWLPPVAVNSALAFILLGSGTLLATHGAEGRDGRRAAALSAVESRTLVGFIGALLMLLLAGGFTYRATDELAASSQWVVHTQQVRAALRRIYATISDAESAQRDYLITGIPQRRDSYADLTAKVHDQEEVLSRLVADNPGQLENLAQFRRLVERRLDLLRHGVDLYQQQGFAAARQFVASGEGTSTMQAIIALTESMDAMEEKLLVEREATFTRIRHRTLALLLFTLLAATYIFTKLYRGIRREMVARNAAEQSLVQRSAEVTAANRFLDSVIENIPGMIFVKDASDLRFVRVNRAEEELLGHSSSDLLGKNDYDLFPAKEAGLLIAQDREVLANGVVKDIPEDPIRTRDKRVRILHTRKIPILDQNRRPLYLLGISEDVTEQKEKEREILRLNAALEHRATEVEAANKELESFSYSVSHDLRAPLRHINGYAEMLGEDAASTFSSEARRYLQVIADASGQMGQLIDDLLEFSRMGRVEMRQTIVALDSVVREALRSLEMSTRARDIVWTVAPLPAVTGDPALLKLVFANLLGNAVKYTRLRDVARIEIGEAGEEGGRSIIFVRDNGAGFDMKYADKLFGVFQRLHRAEEFEGTGVGLANVRRIIARHGGRVWAVAAPDNGATFFFTLTPAPSTGGETRSGQPA